MTTLLTAESIKAILDADGVALNKQDKVIADLLAAQATPLPDPPLSFDEKRQIIRRIRANNLYTEWPAWAARQAQVKKELTTLLSLYDANLAAKDALEGGLLALELSLPPVQS